jgi:acetoin utilization deacetylase AcuC-like enzyme
MEILFNKATLEHNRGSDIEGPYRINKLLTKVGEANPGLKGTELLGLVHPNSYINKIKDLCNRNATTAEVKLTPESFTAASISAALAVQAAIEGNFAVIRPPGHHASQRRELGFCLFNNIAIASKYLINQGKKVFIIDIDAHYGNGTHNIVLNLENVTYASIHMGLQFPDFGTEPKIIKVRNQTKVINIPIPNQSRDDILLGSLNFLEDQVKSANPDVIGVSAGFDGHYLDRIGHLGYTEAGFYEVGKFIRSLNTEVFAVLEGGYHEKVVDSILTFVAGINGKDQHTPTKITVSTENIKNHFEQTLKLLKNKLRR